jgi:hypothetical protein
VTTAKTPAHRWRRQFRAVAIVVDFVAIVVNFVACRAVGIVIDAPSRSWSRSSPVAPSPSTYNRIWAEVGMVVGDDVDIDAINEFIVDFT